MCEDFFVVLSVVGSVPALVDCQVHFFMLPQLSALQVMYPYSNNR